MPDKKIRDVWNNWGDKEKAPLPERATPRPDFTKEEENALEHFLSCLQKSAPLPSFLISRPNIHSPSLIQAVLQSLPEWRPRAKVEKAERLLFFKTAYAITKQFTCPFNTSTDETFKEIFHFLEALNDTTREGQALINTLEYFHETKFCVCDDRFSKHDLLAALVKMVKAFS